MSNLSIQTFLTDEITDSMWNSYLKNFNSVFKKSFDLKYFKNKYDSHFNNLSYKFNQESNNLIVSSSKNLNMEIINKIKELK